MEFELSDEQRAFQETARTFAHEEWLPYAAGWDVRVHQILEGTNEIMRVIIARRLLGNL